MTYILDLGPWHVGPFPTHIAAQYWAETHGVDDYRMIPLDDPAEAPARIYRMREYCAKVPGNGERRRRRYLTREELQQLLAALDGFAPAGVRWRFAQLVRLLLLTGCRVSEIKDARWSWLQDSILVVPAECHKTGRDGHPRLVHLTPAALKVLEQLRARSNGEWIIQGDGDHPLIGYQKLWQELRTTAKLADLLVHDLRHHYASMGISAGLTLKQIGGLLGHASPLTTDRYAHLVDEAAAAAASKVIIPGWQ